MGIVGKSFITCEMCDSDLSYEDISIKELEDGDFEFFCAFCECELFLTEVQKADLFENLKEE